ncbi:MAG: disulfide bond formation protein B [Burkholderiales bacterium]|nr:disulfide bond formation protein B [Burkholderiales bacterium]
MSRRGYSSSVWLLIVAVTSFAAVGAALVSQYYFDLQPCPWCTFQRLLFIVTGLLALFAAVMPGVLQRLLALLAAAAALGGVASALWQHFVAAASDSCAMTFADNVMGQLRLFDLAPSVFSPTASCAEAAVKLLGVPYEFYSLALFAFGAIVCLRAVFRRGA